MASLPGAVPAGADQPGRMSALVWAALTVGLYAVYVACVVVPDARAEMALTVAWGRDVSDLRWQRTDQWTELASGRIDSSLKLENQVAHLSGWMGKTASAVHDLTSSLHGWLGRAHAAVRVVQHHVRDAHAPTRRPRLCVVAVEPPDVSPDRPLPLLRSLQAQAAQVRPRWFVFVVVTDRPLSQESKEADVALYLASSAHDAALRRHYQHAALASHVAIQRVVCPGASSHAQQLNCAAERCFADLYHYILPTVASATLRGPNWIASVTKQLRARDDLGAVSVQLVAGATAYPTAVVGRAHMRVFDGNLFPIPSLTVASLAPFLARVYAPHFFFDIPLRKASLIVPAAEWVADSSGVASAGGQEEHVGAWREYLCRHKLWARYCSEADVKHYLQLPVHHVGKSLTRHELEAMEEASKRGHVADMAKILEAQHRAQLRDRERRRERDAAKQVHIGKLREALQDAGKALTDKEIVEVGVCLLHAATNTPWKQLFAMPLAQVCEGAASHVARHRDALELRWAVDRALQHKAVLPTGPDAAPLAATVRELIAEMGGETKGTSDDDLKLLRSRFEASFAALQRAHADAAPDELPELLRRPVEAVAQLPPVLPDGEVPCVVDGVAVPTPWFARRVAGVFSSSCFAKKSAAERCCDHPTPDGFCVAKFAGYGANSVRNWINSCRSPGWGAEIASAAAESPGAKGVEVSAVAASSALDQVDGPRCIVAGAAVPLPWRFAMAGPGIRCVAPKFGSARERCCDYQSKDTMCVAVFDGYSWRDMQGWLDHCRSAHWHDTAADVHAAVASSPTSKRPW